MSMFADEVYGTLAPAAAQDADNGMALQTYVGAVGSMFGGVEALFRSADPSVPAGAAVVDVDTAPDWWLAWLGQMVGVQVTQGATPDFQRAEIRYMRGFKRGTVASMVAAAQQTLTGNQTVAVYERNGGAYGMLVVTYTDETPDPAATERAVVAAKAAGRFPFTYRTDPGWSIGTMETAYATIADVEAAFSSVANLESNLP